MSRHVKTTKDKHSRIGFWAAYTTRNVSWDMQKAQPVGFSLSTGTELVSVETDDEN